MASDGSSDAVDLNLAVHLGEFLFDKIRNSSCIFVAIGITYEYLSGIIEAAFGTLLHHLYDTLDDSLLASYLLARDKLSFVVNNQKRADTQNGSDGTCGLAYSSASDKEGKIR